jgi:hypothetical protein
MVRMMMIMMMLMMMMIMLMMTVVCLSVQLGGFVMIRGYLKDYLCDPNWWRQHK